MKNWARFSLELVHFEINFSKNVLYLCVPKYWFIFAIGWPNSVILEKKKRNVVQVILKQIFETNHDELYHVAQFASLNKILNAYTTISWVFLKHPFISVRQHRKKISPCIDLLFPAFVQSQADSPETACCSCPVSPGLCLFIVSNH